jgi:hypothetical protein
LQEIVTTSPEGQRKDRSSTTPASQSVSKNVRLGWAEFESEELEVEEEDGVGLSLCCKATLAEQFTLPKRHGELPNDTKSGRDKRDSEAVSFVKFVTTTVAEGVSVSEIEIWKGKRTPDESSRDC